MTKKLKDIFNKIDGFMSILVFPLKLLIILLSALLSVWNKIQYAVKEYFILPIQTGKKIRTIEIKRNNILLKIGSRFSESIPIDDVKNIYYSIDIKNFEVYFYVNIYQNKYRQRFGREYCIKYTVEDIDDFLNDMQENNVRVIPYFDGGVTCCRGNLYQFCKQKEKYLLTLAGNTETVCYEDSENQTHCFHIPLKNLNINQALNDPISYFKDKLRTDSYCFDNVIYILGDSLSLNRGYVLIPEKDINIAEKDIQYFKDFEKLVKKCEDFFVEITK